MQNWLYDLCEYFSVDEETAVELGTRKKGRTPDLPGTATCKPVNGLTFEQIWDSKPRNTIQEKMDFYKDLGAWQVFRQSVYRQDLDVTPFIQYLDMKDKPEINICEYGCGIAPFTNGIVEKVNGSIPENVKFELVDVEGEHLHFAKWRLNKKSPEAIFDFHEISEENMIPTFNRKLDYVFIMDVLEHVPNPLEVIKNICENSNEGAILVETWVDVREPGYADLSESVEQRDETLKYISDNYKQIASDGATVRLHRKK